MVLVFSFLMTSLSAMAAPHPTTGSSAVNDLRQGIMFSQLGFKLNQIPQGWSLATDSTTENKKMVLHNQTAFLNFSLDETKAVVDLEKYVKRFLKDYNQFGFELSELQSFKKNATQPFIVLELTQKNKKTKSRQIFFQNGKKIVTATCIDEYDHFDRTVHSCNQILNNFSWN